MCGRYTQTQTLKALAERFGAQAEAIQSGPRYNIAPSRPAVIVVSAAAREFRMARWGLVPSWAKDPALGNKLINARAETLSEKPSFKRAFESRRCLVPADGFYEWARKGASKIPYRFTLKDGSLFSFAGLWEAWRAPDGRMLETFTIVTTSANDLLKSIHDRMPVILRKEDEPLWLDPTTGTTAEVKDLLRPYPAEAMAAGEVSALVNSPKNDGPACLAHPGMAEVIEETGGPE